MLTGTCHCGACGWTLEGDPGRVTTCNCTMCRRSGTLWAYDYEGERIHVSGPLRPYVRADEPDPALENLFCPTCANVVAWRGFTVDGQGRRRMGVNIRLTEPSQVADLPLRRLDGLGDFAELPNEGRCVRDMWF